MFFSLSGFLITGILLNTQSALNRARSFYGRRVLRIFPVYYMALGVVLVAEAHVPWVKAAANMQNLADHLSYLFYFQNWIPLWHHGDYPESFLGHFWSLAVEEQFYLIWPAVVWHLSARAIIKLCSVALVFSLVLRLFLVSHFGNGIWLYAFTITRADGLYAGSALAAIYAIKGHFSNRLLTGLTVGGVAGLATVAALGPANALWLTGPKMATFGISGLALLSGAFIVLSLRFAGSGVGRFLQQRWLRTFGKYSYGMYVWHFPIYYCMQHLLEAQSVVFPLRTSRAFPYLALLIALSYGAAWVSFNFYEQWFLRLKARFEPIYSQQPRTQPTPGWISQQNPVIDRP